jgi:hypothetical protein
VINVEALTANVWGAIHYRKWINGDLTLLPDILMLQGMLHMLTVGKKGKCKRKQYSYSLQSV